MKFLTGVFITGLVPILVMIGIFSSAGNQAPNATTVPSAARAEPDLVDRLYPECRNTPIGQMTRGQLEKCDAVERITGGVKAAFDRAHSR
jgi:hypothetical protein